MGNAHQLTLGNFVDSIGFIMAVRQDTLWEQFLSPIIQSLLDKEQMSKLRDRLDLAYSAAWAFCLTSNNWGEILYRIVMESAARGMRLRS